MIDQNPSAAARGADRAGFMLGSNSELAQGLLLMRASAMKVVRLQLAMQRQDRAVAIQTMDDLLALDSTIRHFVADIPGAEELEAVQRALDVERSTLNREKFGLTAGMVKRGDEREDLPAIQPAVPQVAVPEPAPSAEAQSDPASEVVHAGSDESPTPRRLWPWALLGFAIACAVTVAAFLLAGSDFGQMIFGHLFGKGM
jgi:hypothetical protein